MVDNVRSSQVYVENILKPVGTPQVRCTQLYVEVIRSKQLQAVVRAGAHSTTVIAT